jgi:hypothetical protein
MCFIFLSNLTPRLSSGPKQTQLLQCLRKAAIFPPSAQGGVMSFSIYLFEINTQQLNKPNVPCKTGMLINKGNAVEIREIIFA